MSHRPILKPGQHALLYATFLRDETQRLTLTGGPTGGSVRLTYDGGPSTEPLTYESQAVTVQDTIERLANVGRDNILCTGGPWPSAAIDVTFVEGLGKRQRPLITLAENLLTGGSPGLSVTRQVVGGQAEPVTVTFTITDPKGVDIVYTWAGADADIVKVGPAQFRVKHEIAMNADSGQWHWSAQGDGNVDDVAEGSFIVAKRTAQA